MHRGPGSEKIVLQERFVSEAGGSPMRTECSADLFGFAPVEGRAVVAAFDGGMMTSEAGAMLLGAADRTIGLVARFAGCFTDHRAAIWWSTRWRAWSVSGYSGSRWATRI